VHVARSSMVRLLLWMLACRRLAPFLMLRLSLLSWHLSIFDCLYSRGSISFLLVSLASVEFILCRCLFFEKLKLCSRPKDQVLSLGTSAVNVVVQHTVCLLFNSCTWKSKKCDPAYIKKEYTDMGLCYTINWNPSDILQSEDTGRLSHVPVCHCV